MSINESIKNNIMKIVISEVDVAVKEGNSPFAAVLVDEFGKVLYKAHNTCKSDNDPTAHAEINLIRKACKDLKKINLSNYILVSNAWSCSMCMSASIKAGITNYIFGTKSESNMNPNLTIYDIKNKTKQTLNIITGVLEEDCQRQIDIARKNNK